MALVGQAVPEERKSAAPYSRYRSPERSCYGKLPGSSRLSSVYGTSPRSPCWPVP